MMSMFHETSEGDTFRTKFLLKYLTKRVVGFIFWTSILLLISKSVFVGGIFSSTRMSLNLQREETAWFYSEHFFSTILDNEFPFEEEQFVKTFGGIQGPDDVWTFTNGVLLDALFPEGETPGQVAQFAYLVGSPVIQNKPYTTGDCDGPLMNIPSMFEDIEQTATQLKCVTGVKSYQNDVVLPRNNRTAAIEAVNGIDKDAFAASAGVRISYAIYNTQLQRVLVSDLRVDFRAGGYAVPIPKTRVFLWMPINDISSWLYQFVLCSLFVGYSLFNLAGEVIQMSRDPIGYLTDGAELFDLLRDSVHLLIICLLVLVVVKQAQLTDVLEPAGEDPTTTANYPVDLDTIAYYSSHLQKSFGATFMLQTFNSIKLLKLFPSLGPQMQAIGQTLVDAKVTQFLGFLIVCVFGCAMTVHTIFGTESPEFATLPESFFGMYRFVWGDWDYADSFSIQKLFGPGADAWYGYVFFLVVTFVITGTLANVFIAIVGERYNDHLAKSEESWVEEVNGIMTKLFGEYFERAQANRFNSREELVKVVSDPLKQGWMAEKSAEVKTEDGAVSAAAQELSASMRDMRTKVEEHQQRMQDMGSSVQEMKALLQKLAAQHTSTVTASV
jgi:hypothetical protein